MVDRPILFSGPMVRAILDGRKTQTRRVMKPQPPADMGLVGIYAPKLTAVFGYETPDADCKIPLRYMPGDRLWVRETWCHGLSELGQAPAYYRADGEDDCTTWRPSIFMPRWASRLTLIVTDVRVQRLQDISEEDARAEGVEPTVEITAPWGAQETPCWFSFMKLWDSLNASRGYGWEANPWVVALTFTVHHQNIDELDK